MRPKIRCDGESWKFWYFRRELNWSSHKTGAPAKMMHEVERNWTSRLRLTFADAAFGSCRYPASTTIIQIALSVPTGGHAFLVVVGHAEVASTDRAIWGGKHHARNHNARNMRALCRCRGGQHVRAGQVRSKDVPSSRKPHVTSSIYNTQSANQSRKGKRRDTV